MTLSQRIIGNQYSPGFVVDPIQNGIIAVEVIQALLEGTSESTVIINKAGIIEVCNEAFCQFIGSKKEMVLGKHVSDVLPELGLTKVFETDEPEYIEVKSIKGQDVIVTNLRISSGPEIVGAIGKIMMEQVFETDVLVNKINLLKSRIAYYREQLESMSGSRFRIENIVGNSQVISSLKEVILKIAHGNSTVLLRGEPGTGKELVSCVIHRESARKHGPYVKINCAKFTGSTLEFELFGAADTIVNGVITRGQVGKLELADQGTLFLEGIDKMSLSLQAKIVKVLREKMIQRVGEDTLRPVDIRFVAATDQNLEELIRQKLFREDLYYLFNVVSFYIPPLRDRQDDLRPLINFLVEKLNREFGKMVIGVSPEVYEIFKKHTWPGNVRELRSVLASAFNSVEDKRIEVHHLPACLRSGFVSQSKTKEKVGLKNILDETERNTIIQALERAGGSKVKAARMLGISRASLYQKLEKYDLLNG